MEPKKCFFSARPISYLKSTVFTPWLVWLSGLSASLQTKKLPVQFPVRAHAWVVGQDPIWGNARGNLSMFLSLSLPPFTSNK